jgi:large subunit ribosomal protein L34
MSTKRTFQPGKSRRIKKLGFRAKMKTLGGRKVIKRRMVKGRKKLTP